MKFFLKRQNHERDIPIIRSYELMGIHSFKKEMYSFSSGYSPYVCKVWMVYIHLHMLNSSYGNQFQNYTSSIKTIKEL